MTANLAQDELDALYAQARHGDQPTARGTLDHLTPGRVAPATKVALLLAERRIAVLGCDANKGATPSQVEDVASAVHALTINAPGPHRHDHPRLDGLAARRAQRGRWEFLCAIAPLRVTGGTGSPVNPIAVF